MDRPKKEDQFDDLKRATRELLGYAPFVEFLGWIKRERDARDRENRARDTENRTTEAEALTSILDWCAECRSPRESKDRQVDEPQGTF